MPSTIDTVLPRAQWDAVAFLRRAGKPVNAAVLRSVVDSAAEDLLELVDRGLIQAFERVGDHHRPVDLANYSYLPGVDVALTPGGREVGAWVVRIAGALYWLAGRRNAQRVPLNRLVDAAEMSDADVAELDRRRWIELYLVGVRGDEPPVGFGDVSASKAGVYVRVTRLGKRYTTQHS